MRRSARARGVGVGGPAAAEEEEEGEVVAAGRVAGRGGRTGPGARDVAAPMLTAACLTTRGEAVVGRSVGRARAARGAGVRDARCVCAGGRVFVLVA